MVKVFVGIVGNQQLLNFIIFFKKSFQALINNKHDDSKRTA